MSNNVFSRVLRILGLGPPMDAQLVPLETYRREERIARCNGIDPLETVVAYAQNSLVYTSDNRIIEADAATYDATPMNDRVNKFGKAYASNMPLLLHKQLADVVVDAAVDLYHHNPDHRLRLRVYDGLRTVNATERLINDADPQWLADGLLAAPGKSAHNRALAVDSSLVDSEGREIERFDNLDMKINHRDYTGASITPEQREARLLKERAFQRAAIKHGLALAPLQSEYWDDRVPGSEADLWRVIASLARCTGQPQPEQRADNYPAFCAQWKALNQNGALITLFGPEAAHPPIKEAIVFHEYLPSIYDADIQKIHPRPSLAVAI